MPRRALVSAAALALAGCATVPEPAPVPVTTRAPLAPPPRAPRLAMLQGGGPAPAVAGETLNAALLRRFYARHGFEPVWADRPEQAAALTEAVLGAGGHGLDPALFHAALLRRQSDFPPLERELLLSSAVLSYADALAHGRVAAGRRRRVEALATPPADLAATLGEAIMGSDPRAALEGLAPAAPGYAALRTALAQPAPAGPAGATRARALAVNLERQRWLPRELPAERVWVNVADQQLTYFRDGRPVLTSRVVVGNESERDQSPEFQAMIEGAFFNPPWVVPKDIVDADILPRLAREPDYLEKRNMVLRENGEVEQRPGPNAALGVLLFDMPNPFDVFLHDTPARHFFSRDARRLSYGCIRVEKPRELAALLLRRPIAAINEEVATGVTTRRALPAPVPVFVVYQTAFADDGARVQFRPDFYGRDLPVWQRLRGAPARPETA